MELMGRGSHPVVRGEPLGYRAKAEVDTKSAQRAATRRSGWGGSARCYSNPAAVQTQRGVIAAFNQALLGGPVESVPLWGLAMERLFDSLPRALNQLSWVAPLQGSGRHGRTGRHREP